MANILGGLLGDSFDDPKTLGLLQLASSLSTGRKVVPALAQGLLGRSQIMQESEQAQARKQMQALQMQQQQMQIAQAQRAAELQKQQDAFRQSIPSPQMLGIQGAMGANGGPTNAAAAAIPQVDPNAQMMHGALRAGLIDPVAYINSQRKDNTPMKLSAGEALIDPKTFKPIYTNPKEDSTPSAVKEYAFAKQQGYGGSFLDFQLAQKRAGASSVSVNTGTKAFDQDLGKLGVSILEKGRESAQAAAGIVESVGQIRQAAAQGAYQGAGADLKLGAAKALGALGMPYDAKTVANTELFSAQANTFVLNNIKQLGVNPSNADRIFIEKTVPRLQTDPAALPELLDFMEDKARRQIGGYNRQARQAQEASSFLPFSLEVPEPQAARGKPAPAKLSDAEAQELAALRARFGGSKP